jgi:hypothetical protein
VETNHHTQHMSYCHLPLKQIKLHHPKWVSDFRLFTFNTLSLLYWSNWNWIVPLWFEKRWEIEMISICDICDIWFRVENFICQVLQPQKQVILRIIDIFPQLVLRREPKNWLCQPFSEEEQKRKQI